MVNGSEYRIGYSYQCRRTILFLGSYAISSPLFCGKDGHKCTTLYSLTFPPQKKCVVLSHPSAHYVQKINKANVEHNKGVEAGRVRSLNFNSTSGLICPAGHSKSFCLGWNQTACSSEGCGGDYTCINPNQPKGAVGCRNDKNYMG
ncbi:MAG: hypothetical protein WAK17_29920 [Candidatus Nitrosopolaris sp.]